ncbi:MAG: hypothetical protein Q8Q32_02390 [bacterium]|nr:hypothetical protein [bacterium]
MKKYLLDFGLGVVMAVILFLGLLPLTGDVGLFLTLFDDSRLDLIFNIFIAFALFLSIKKIVRAGITHMSIWVFVLGLIAGTFVNWLVLYVSFQ